MKTWRTFQKLYFKISQDVSQPACYRLKQFGFLFLFETIALVRICIILYLYETFGSKCWGISTFQIQYIIIFLGFPGLCAKILIFVGSMKLCEKTLFSVFSFSGLSLNPANAEPQSSKPDFACRKVILGSF